MGKGSGDDCRTPMTLDSAAAPGGDLGIGDPKRYTPLTVSDDELDRLQAAVFDGLSRFDEQAALRFHLARPVTPGAVRVPLYELEQLAALLHAHPQAVVAVSDVHGDLAKLREVLERLEVVDAAGRRTGRGELIQLGDLVDGRNEHDYDTLVWGAERFDVLLCGNHEAALMGGGRFDGQPGVTPPEIMDIFRRLTSPYDLRLHAAVARHGVLFSHAGVNAQTFDGTDPDQVAGQVTGEWEMFLARNSHQPDALFGVPKARGGTASAGGVLWQHWGDLVRRPNPAFRQVVGHTPLGGVEADPAGRVFAADCGGSRLGVCVLLEDGRMCFGSDLVPGD